MYTTYVVVLVKGFSLAMPSKWRIAFNKNYYKIVLSNVNSFL